MDKERKHIAEVFKRITERQNKLNPGALAFVESLRYWFRKNKGLSEKQLNALQGIDRSLRMQI